ncbi:MAG: hypothetical protein Kow0089_21280 [Desulfobulbaceae bacterium]
MFRRLLNANIFSREGFTLLEVMIAVSIIAVAFVTLIGSQSQSVSIAAQTRFAITSALLAQQKMTEIEATDFGSVFSEQGDFGDEYPGYSWQTEVITLGESETGIEGSADMLKAVDVTVFRGGKEGSSYTVRTVIMKRIEPAP